MLVYLFRRNGDHALTTDMTGRNLPSRNPSSHWMFVEALDTKNTRTNTSRDGTSPKSTVCSAG